MNRIRSTLKASIRNTLGATLLGLLFAGAALAGERVNVNTADAATLDRVLDGVGPSKAEAIVQYRKANGPFRSVEQLASVKGIGLATIERNRDRIVVAGGAPAAAAPAKPGAKPAARPASPVAKSGSR